MTTIISDFLALFILVICISLHEFGHAAMSTKLGDPTPRLQGRLTVDPRAHFDPIGFLFIAMLIFFHFGMGWGKPVQSNPLYYKNYKEGIILTAMAGPMMNLCLAMFGLGFAYVLFLTHADFPPVVHMFLFLWISINIGLILFNMLPIPPLDGGHLLQQLAPRGMAPLVRFLQSFGFLIVLGLVFFGLLGPIFSLFYSGILAVIKAGFGPDFTAFLLAAGY